jgi:hypothetical protein
MPGDIGGGEVLFALIALIWADPSALGGGCESGILFYCHRKGTDAESIYVQFVQGL